MDFGALPPEVNSLRMYTGPGSAPMLAAVAAWDRLAVELQATAAAYDTIISVLTDDGWLGPASESMREALTPYLAWMTRTGLKAEDAATQAAAAAAAYEAAYTTTVPPAAVAANRAELQTLVATNLVGQNTPAIAVTEAAYGEMWAQDAAAMYGYATSSATASSLTPFTQPAQVTNPAGQSGQGAAVMQAAGSAAGTVTQSQLPQLMSSVPSTLQGLAAPAATAEAFPGADLLANILNFLDGNDGNPYGIFLNSDLVNGFVSAGYINPAILAPGAFAGLADINAVALGAQESAVPPMGSGEGNATWIPAGTPGDPISLPPLDDVDLTSATTRGVTAGINQSTLVGRLSVPHTWTEATAVANYAGTATPGGGWNNTAIAPEAASGMPGVPGMPAPGMYGHNFGNAPRYGFRPTIMTRPPAAG